MGPLEIKGLILCLAVFAGTACIYMGYRLFLAGIIQPGTAKASAAGVKITWAGYGPGVAFALFGAWLITAAVNRDLVSEYERITDPLTGIVHDYGRVAGAQGPAVQPASSPR